MSGRLGRWSPEGRRSPRVTNILSRFQTFLPPPNSGGHAITGPLSCRHCALSPPPNNMDAKQLCCSSDQLHGKFGVAGRPLTTVTCLVRRSRLWKSWSILLDY
ncbi:hypothetical protein GN956_G18842 [Arapaima gigas]